MAGLMSRMSTVVKAWISRLLDRAEDPSVTLDYSYERQREQLQKVKKGVAEVVTAKKRPAPTQARDELQARSAGPPALGAGREAREAGARAQGFCAAATPEPRPADRRPRGRQGHRIVGESAWQPRSRPSGRRRRRSRRSTPAAEARVRITEAASGIGEEMADTGSPSSARATRPSRCRPAPPPSTARRGRHAEDFSAAASSTASSRRSRPAHRWTKSSRA